MSLIRSVFEKPLYRILNPVVGIMARSDIRPNTITTAGFIGNLAATVLLFYGQFIAAGILVWLAGILDMLDGMVARSTKQVSVYGAIYDATLDRIGELGIYTGIGAYFILHGRYFSALIVVIATAGSFLISYIRARAESYDIPCSVGMLCRGERVFLLGLGLILNFLGHLMNKPLQIILAIVHLPHKFPPMPIAVVLVIVAVLSPVTIIQRLHHIKAVQRAG